ncbi:OmpA family protein [Candidatus Colwellia aromaticivorans]|uniref:OmpA family protein n=1 Tax=Candidatus Colwellia aromaticivorans TaxID=2267621 RepID=UPI00144435D6|nr:OmpA family protein [Candidatus Colwellia aromaticivorans]
MKTFKITLLAALISSPLAAEAIDKTWEVGVFGEYIKSSTNKEDQADWQQIEAGRGIGIDLEKIINDQWNARFELAKTRYDIQNGNDTDYGTRFGIDAIYKVKDSGLYLFAGVKRFNNVKSYNAVNVGAGYSYQINERFSLYSEAVVYRDVDYGYTDQGIKFGLKYAFGEATKTAVVSKPVEQEVIPASVEKEIVPVSAVAVIITDTDNDGISDENDNCKNTPKNVEVDPKGCPLFLDTAVDVELNVSFETNSAQLKTESMVDIQRLADFMAEYKNTSAAIEGHSSAVGNEKYNLTLSQKRADAVKKVLITQFNIEESRLSSTGFGETQLISKGNTKADHKVNRRVVASIEATVKKMKIKG